jgi:hypothetical protein
MLTAAEIAAPRRCGWFVHQAGEFVGAAARVERWPEAWSPEPGARDRAL